MCVVCGCSNSGGVAAPRPTGDERPPSLSHPAVDPRTGDLHYGTGAARVSVPGMSQARAIRLEADVLGENRRLATLNRTHFEGHGVAAYNLVSSPGSGKTTLLCATIEALWRRLPALPLAVIEGDQQTSNDADRIRATGAPAIQVNTGKGCHLDAQMVGEAFGRLPLHSHGHGNEHPGKHRPDHAHAPVQGQAGHVHDHDHDHDHDHAHDHERAHHGYHAHDGHHHHDDPAPGAPAAILFIENVGNLVCPALWDLGERAKVVILSVTEGEDKPLKYPDMFAAAQLMVLNKIDLLPHLDFDVQRCVEYARQVNPGIEVVQVSAKTGQGLDDWLDWLLHAGAPLAAPAPAAPPNAVASPSGTEHRAHIARLEAELAQARRR